MRIVLTGSAGFLGWHTRTRLHALTVHDVIAVTRADWDQLPQLLDGASAIVHIAGVNRGAPGEVETGNVRLAEDLADAIRAHGSPMRVVFANSIQAGNGTPYGSGKATAAALLAEATTSVGGHFVDVLLPNLFGEHGRPGYNSFVATFVGAVVRGETPPVQDREVSLLHAQDAAQSLIDGLAADVNQLSPAGTATSVVGVLTTLERFHSLYATGDIPPLDSKLAVDLFNTYRSALFPLSYPISLISHTDDRGRLVETVRCHGGQGQTFVSTTRPGITRGEHFHLGKVERFVVLSGRARISLRKVCTDQIVSFDVNGDEPAVIDMPTMWVHNITNTGEDDLTTLFWTHSLFDPEHPDTYWEPVATMVHT